MRMLRLGRVAAIAGLCAVMLAGCDDNDSTTNAIASPTPTATATPTVPAATVTPTLGEICIGPRCFVPSPTPPP